MSFSQYLTGHAIRTGCDWRLRIRIFTTSGDDVFPADAAFACHFRSPAGALLAELTSQNGRVVRVDGSTVELVLQSTDSVDWSESVDLVLADVVRSDLARPVHLGFDLAIPVKQSITRL